MKKKIIMMVMLFTIFYGLGFSQTTGDPNYIILPETEGQMYLDSLNNYWGKIQKLPKGKKDGDYWSHDKNLVGTVGKVIGDKRYTLIINKEVDLGEGKISQMIFCIRQNDSEKQYFPIETMTFYYRHKDKKSVVIWSIFESKNDSVLHKKEPEWIKGRISELMKNINSYI